MKVLTLRQAQGDKIFMNKNAELLQKACTISNIQFQILDDFGNLILIKKNNKKYYFHGNHTPLNDSMVTRLSQDKEFHYRILNKHIKMPLTFGYLDPNVHKKYAEYKMFNSIDHIVGEILNNFTFPMIIKRNKGSEGQNVFLVKNENKLVSSLKKIYKKNYSYDYLAIAQEYIKPRSEYRVVVLNSKIELMYKKDTTDAKRKTNLSPLHWEGSKTVKILNEEFIEKMQSFLNPIFDVINLKFGGIDVIEDENGKLWLIEINSSPGFHYYVKDNGEEDVVELYGKMIEYFK